MKIYYYIYKTTNLLNGKYYIGVHKTKNLEDEYVGSGKYLKRAINKYGIENFKKEILKFFDTEEEMWKEEAEIINEEFVKEKDNYNLHVGGNGGFDYINENSMNGFKNDNSLAKKGRKAADKKLEEKYGKNWRSIISKMGDDSYKNKYGENWKSIVMKGNKNWVGRKHTEQSKRKIGKASSVHQKGKGNSNYGTCWIYNTELEQNKKIKKVALEEWIEKGWKQGRKMNW